MLTEIAVAAGLAKTIQNAVKSDKLDKQAERKNIKSFTKIAESQESVEREKSVMESAVLKLMTRKRAVLSTSMKSFLMLYERIIKINFNETDGIDELCSFTPELIEETRLQVTIAGQVNDPPIMTKNVLISGLVGGFFGSVSASVLDDSERNLDVARLHSKQAEAIALQAKTITLSYQAITERVNRVKDVLTRLNLLFWKSIQNTMLIIDKNGEDKSKYTAEDRKKLAACINLAGAVKGLLDVPVIDANGEVTKKSMEAILNCERDMESINFVV